MTTGIQKTEKLPTNWKNIRLKDISKRIHYGYTSKSSINEIGPKYLRITDIDGYRVNWEEVPHCKIEEVRKEKYLLKSGDLVFARTGSIGKSFLLKDPIPEAVFASYLIRVILDGKVNNNYIYYFFQSPMYWKQIMEQKTGIVQPNVNAQKLSELVIPLAPSSDQEIIVSRLDELFSKLDTGQASLQRTKFLLNHYRHAILKAAMTGELTKEWREKHQYELEPASVLLERILLERRQKWEEEQLAKFQVKGKKPQDDSWKKKYKDPNESEVDVLPTIPINWIWVTLTQIGELNRGRSKHRPRNAPYLFGGSYPFIQTGDVKNSEGMIKSFKQTYSEEGLKQSKLWPKGTLCITIAANIADTAILGFDACFPDSIVGFLPEENHCNIRFIEYFLRTAKQKIELYAPATAQKNINLEILSKIAIAFPSLQEQKIIAEELDKQFSVINNFEEDIILNSQMNKSLKQSILKSAFEGKLVQENLLLEYKSNQDKKEEGETNTIKST